MTLHIVQEEAADELLSTNPFALLCGMLLLQHAPIEVAFAGPAKIRDRFGSLEPDSVATVPDEDFAKMCATEPGIHPYPESMAVLIQAVARYIVANYEGDTAAVWQTAESGELLLSRLTMLPGFSKRQAQEFIALLGKQLGVRPPGWEEAAGPYAKPGSYRSVADVEDPETLEKVQAPKSRRRGGSDQAGGHNRDRTGTSTTSSKGAKVKSDEEKAEKAQRVEARKAARKGAKRAANKTSTEQLAADSSVEGEGAGARAGARKTGLKAKKAAKRAARREARAADPDAAAKKGGGRSADGSKAKRQGRGKKAAERAARRNAAAGESEGPDDEFATESDAGPAGESSATPEPGSEMDDAESPEGAGTDGGQPQG